MDQVDRDHFEVDSSADRIDVDRIRIRCGSDVDPCASADRPLVFTCISNFERQANAQINTHIYTREDTCV